MSAKILVIDDEPEVGCAIARMLKGYETSTETDPRCAVRRIADGEQFDLVLCDLNMPQMSGREVYDAVHRDGFDREPMMLMMSGRANVARLYAAGCPVLIKPFASAELRVLVSALLHEGADAASASSAHPG